MALPKTPFGILPEDEEAAAGYTSNDLSGGVGDTGGEDPGPVYGPDVPQEPEPGFPMPGDDGGIYTTTPVGEPVPLEPGTTVEPVPEPTPEPTPEPAPPIPPGPVPTPDPDAPDATEDIPVPIAPPPIAQTPTGIGGTFKMGRDLGAGFRTPGFNNDRLMGGGEYRFGPGAPIVGPSAPFPGSAPGGDDASSEGASDDDLLRAIMNGARGRSRRMAGR